jgi:hypothetical protein
VMSLAMLLIVLGLMFLLTRVGPLTDLLGL